MPFMEYSSQGEEDRGIVEYAGAPGGLGVGLGLIPFLIAIVVASFLLGGREQAEAAEEEIATGTGAR
jgi:hypothetical protein